MTDQNPSSLDLGSNNSTDADTRDSRRYDCREVYRNFELESDQGDTADFRCGSWKCYCCGYRMRQNLVEEIERISSERPEMSRLLTLTLDPARAPSDQDEQHKYLTERWNALRTRLKREIGDFSYIWVREEQESGLPHLHAIVSRYLPHGVVSQAWDELGGGEIVDIRKIERADKAAHYVGKYLTKHALTGLPDNIQRYNSSSDITLHVRDNGSDDETDWSLMMDDYMTDLDDVIRREVNTEDFAIQQDWGGPIPLDKILRNAESSDGH